MVEFNLEKAKQYGFHIPKKKASEYDEDEFNKGIEVESEHTDDREICMLIAAHHLDEIRDYYTRLHQMEAEAKDELGEIKESKAMSELADVIPENVI